MSNFEKEKRIVNNEVYVCQTCLVEELLNNSTFSYDDIQNMYIDNSEQIFKLQEEKEKIEEQIEELDEKIGLFEIDDKLEQDEEIIELVEKIQELKEEIKELDEKMEELEEEEETPNEPLEYWCVSNWLKEKLLKYNEPILENDFGTWWGRCTSGQSIVLDWVIQEIAK